MDIKPHEEWKVRKGLIVECIAKGCKRKARNEGLCWEHLDQKKLEDESN